MFFQYKITENRGNEVIIVELADKVTVLSGSIDLLEVLLNEARLQESFDD